MERYKDRKIKRRRAIQEGDKERKMVNDRHDRRKDEKVMRKEIRERIKGQMKIEREG